MFNNAVRLTSRSLGDLAATGYALMRRPAVIISAVAAIAMIAKYYPNSKSNYLNSSLCEHLNDTEWESLPLRDDFEDFKQKILFSNLTCTAVTEKLLSELTKDFRKVASDMGYADPSALSLKIDERGNGVTISSEAVEKWWNLETSQQRKQVRGALAHEIAHKILKHHEKVFTRALATLGITVESIEDLDVVFNAINKQSEEASYLSLFAFTILGIPFWKSDYFNSSANESTKQFYADFSSLMQRNLSSLKTALNNALVPEEMRNLEIEADLLTLRVPEYARGLRDLLENELLGCEKLHNSTYCDLVEGMHSGGSTHPATRQRLAYLTDALCEKYPGQNQDICQCSAPDKQV